MIYKFLNDDGRVVEISKGPAKFLQISMSNNESSDHWLVFEFFLSDIENLEEAIYQIKGSIGKDIELEKGNE